jgi:hypothetical protein
MHKHILLILIILSLSFVCSTICWLNLLYPVQKNHCTVYDLVDDPAAMERAILKMGPLYNYTISPDGPVKGKGYLGELKRPDGKVSTELSVGVGFDGKETLIPLLVPTLTKDEIDFLLEGNKPTKEIFNKAVEHAKKRMREKKSPFADSGKIPGLANSG